MGASLSGAGACAGEGNEQVPVFLGYSVAAGARAAAANFIEGSRLPLVLDLDETLLVAYTSKKLCAELSRLAHARADAQASGRARCLPPPTPRTGLLPRHPACIWLPLCVQHMFPQISCLPVCVCAWRLHEVLLQMLGHPTATGAWCQRACIQDCLYPLWSLPQT